MYLHKQMLQLTFTNRKNIDKRKTEFFSYCIGLCLDLRCGFFTLKIVGV